jgi:hypothetical protein
MSMNIEHYIKEINREFVKGNSTEHTFRGTPYDPIIELFLPKSY